jgi:excisionase family DNA binding protein
MVTTSDKVLTIGETSKILRISRPTTLELLRSGKLHGVSVGARGQWRLTEQGISEFLRGGGKGAEKEAAS